MAQKYSDPGAISNYFDALYAGIGHRGSSGTDVDAFTCDPRGITWMTHNKCGTRFLFQEFKYEFETLTHGQHLALRELTRLLRVTVWVVIKCNDGMLSCADLGAGTVHVITPTQQREAYAAWWNAPLSEHDVVAWLEREIAPHLLKQKNHSSWVEAIRIDPSLRAFVDAEIARAHVELNALRVEHAHSQEVIANLLQRIRRDTNKSHTGNLLAGYSRP